MRKRFPQIVASGDNHYLVQKFASVTIDGGLLRFGFGGRGKRDYCYAGPAYRSSVNGEVPLIKFVLEPDGFQSPTKCAMSSPSTAARSPNGLPGACCNRSTSCRNPSALGRLVTCQAEEPWPNP